MTKSRQGDGEEQLVVGPTTVEQETASKEESRNDLESPQSTDTMATIQKDLSSSSSSSSSSWSSNSPCSKNSKDPLHGDGNSNGNSNGNSHGNSNGNSTCSSSTCSCSDKDDGKEENQRKPPSPPPLSSQQKQQEEDEADDHFITTSLPQSATAAVAAAAATAAAAAAATRAAALESRRRRAAPTVASGKIKLRPKQSSTKRIKSSSSSFLKQGSSSSSFQVPNRNSSQQEKFQRTKELLKLEDLQQHRQRAYLSSSSSLDSLVKEEEEDDDDDDDEKEENLIAQTGIVLKDLEDKNNNATTVPSVAAGPSSSEAETELVVGKTESLDITRVSSTNDTTTSSSSSSSDQELKQRARTDQTTPATRLPKIATDPMISTSTPLSNVAAREQEVQNATKNPIRNSTEQQQRQQQLQSSWMVDTKASATASLSSNHQKLQPSYTVTRPTNTTPEQRQQQHQPIVTSSLPPPQQQQQHLIPKIASEQMGFQQIMGQGTRAESATTTSTPAAAAATTTTTTVTSAATSINMTGRARREPSLFSSGEATNSSISWSAGGSSLVQPGAYRCGNFSSEEFSTTSNHSITSPIPGITSSQHTSWGAAEMVEGYVVRDGENDDDDSSDGSFMGDDSDNYHRTPENDVERACVQHAQVVAVSAAAEPKNETSCSRHRCCCCLYSRRRLTVWTVLCIGIILVLAIVVILVLGVGYGGGNDSQKTKNNPSSREGIAKPSPLPPMVSTRPLDLPSDVPVAVVSSTPICFEYVPGSGYSELCTPENTLEKGGGGVNNLVAQAIASQLNGHLIDTTTGGQEQLLDASSSSSTTTTATTSSTRTTATTTTIVLQNAGATPWDLHPFANITAQDAYLLIPSPMPLVQLDNIFGWELHAVLESILERVIARHDCKCEYPYAANLRYHVNASAPPGQRFYNLEVVESTQSTTTTTSSSWVPIEPTTQYTIVLHYSNPTLGRNGYESYLEIDPTLYNNLQNEYGMDASIAMGDNENNSTATTTMDVWYSNRWNRISTLSALDAFLDYAWITKVLKDPSHDLYSTQSYVA